jgi:hypothetical protein
LTVAFVKYYNPVYEFLVMRYLREGGLKFDSKTSLDKAILMASALNKKQDLSSYEKVLRKYVEMWKQSPGHRPSGRVLLKELYGETEPGPPELSRLQSELPQRAGKIVLTKDDVATEISGFYRVYLKESLRKDLETSVGGCLQVYLEPNDETGLERARRFGPARYDAELRKFCEELLSSLANVSPKVVADNIDVVFEEHFGQKNHMRRPSYYHGKKQIVVCDHKTQLVALSGIASKNDRVVSLSFVPARGSPLCHARGDIPVFPWYDVLEIP